MGTLAIARAERKVGERQVDESSARGLHQLWRLLRHLSRFIAPS